MDSSSDSGAEIGGLAAVVPWRLCSGVSKAFSAELLPCINLSKRWQFRGMLAQFWELASREKDRLYEMQDTWPERVSNLACLAWPIMSSACGRQLSCRRPSRTR